MINMFLSNNPSSGDINLSHLACLFYFSFYRTNKIRLHISYIISGGNPKFGVLMHLGVAVRHISFLGHCDIDLDLCPCLIDIQ